MTVTLPTTSPVNIQWSLQDFGGTQSGALGGSAQRVNRLGNRWTVSFTLPPLERSDALNWAQKLTKGLRDGVKWAIVQDAHGAVGTPLVNGASQSGNTLAVDGLTASVSLDQGRFISVTTGSQEYVYQVDAATADGSGLATLNIEPALRVTPADNDPIGFAAPNIEGLLAESMAWTINVDQLVRGLTVTIEETR